MPEVPKGARELAKVAEDIVESVNKTIDLFFADDQRRQNLDDVGIVGRQLE